MSWKPRQQYVGGVARRDRSALLSSLGGLAVVAVVLIGNFWSLLSSKPELAPMDTLQRLSALHDEARLPQSAIASTGPDVPRMDGPASGGVTVRLSAPDAAGLAAPAAVLTRSTAIEPGEVLGVALARLYVHGQTARDVLKAYESVRDPQKIQAGWRLWARFDSAGVMDSGALLSLVVAPQQGEGLTIARDQDGTFAASDGGLPGATVRQALRCGVVGTLEQSLRRCGEGDGLHDLVQGLLADRLTQPIEASTGDEVRIVMDKLMDGDHVVRYQRIAALEYRKGGLTEGRTVALWFDDSHGVAGYFAADGTSVEPLFLRQPLRVGRQTSTFGMRLHPILHRMKAHLGIDFGAPRGTPVFAAATGHLVSAARAGAAGNLVRLRHVESYTTEYMHLQRFATGLKTGGTVLKGQVIGYVGSTGRSTGPHLHFGARHRGQYLDPTELADVPMPALNAKEHKAFEAEAKALQQLLDALGKPPAGSGEAS